MEEVGRCMYAVNKTLLPAWTESLKCSAEKNYRHYHNRKRLETGLDKRRLDISCLARKHNSNKWTRGTTDKVHTGTFSSSEVPLVKAPLRSARGGASFYCSAL